MIKWINDYVRANKRLIDDDITRLWSIRVALFWGTVSFLVGIWSAFEGTLPVWLYSTMGVLMNASVIAARAFKQPGAEE